MGTARTVSCDAFTLTVDDPQRGDRELQIDFVFAPGGPTDDATIELRLCGRMLTSLHLEDRWETEAVVPGTKGRLSRGRTGHLRFGLPLPAFVTSYTGEYVEFAAVVVAEGEDGSRLRLQIEAPPVAADARLVVRGLPREERLSPGLLRGLLRRDRPVAEFSAGPEGTVDVRVRNTREATGGRVTLAACEWSRSDGASTVYDPPIATVTAPLGWQGPGMVGGRLVLPPATAAPAAIETRISGTAQGIHWLARFEIDEAEDSTFRDEVTLHVGVDRPE